MKFIRCDGKVYKRVDALPRGSEVESINHFSKRISDHIYSGFVEIKEAREAFLHSDMFKKSSPHYRELEPVFEELDRLRHQVESVLHKVTKLHMLPEKPFSRLS